MVGDDGKDSSNARPKPTTLTPGSHDGEDGYDDDQPLTLKL